jgi:hypothetical protein
MDIIIHVSRMASDQSRVEAYLDDMRMVTSHVRPGEVPNPEDQKILRSVYLNIENFLVNDDALRTFKKDELRADIAQHFKLAERGGKTFWPSL